MKSKQTKVTLAVVMVMVMVMVLTMLTMIMSTLFGVVAVRNIGRRSADQMLLHLCESGERGLDAYFNSVAQSVEIISAYTESDLDGLEDEKLLAHLDRVRETFATISYKTNGVLTYYYRIDPSVSSVAKGFWFMDLDRDGFREHEVTDITLYDTEDTSKLV